MKLTDKLRCWAQGLKRDSVTLWFAAKSPATPWYAKARGLLLVAYALSPIDLVPDFIPVLGLLDDLLLLPLGVMLAVRLAPRALWQDMLLRAEAFQGRLPRMTAGLVLVLLIWLVLLAAFIVWLLATVWKA